MLNIITAHQLHKNSAILPVSLIKFGEHNIPTDGEHIKITIKGKELNIVLKTSDVEHAIDENTITVHPGSNLLTCFTRINNALNKLKHSFPIQSVLRTGTMCIVSTNEKTKQEDCSIDSNIGQQTNGPVSINKFHGQVNTNEFNTEVIAVFDRRIYKYKDGNQDKHNKGWSFDRYANANKEYYYEAAQPSDEESNIVTESKPQVQQTVVSTTIVLPHNILDNVAFSIHQRIPYEATKTIKDLPIGEQVNVTDRWFIRSYTDDNSTITSERLLDDGSYSILLTTDKENTKYGLDQRVSVDKHDVHMFNYKKDYTFGCKYKVNSGDIELTLKTYILIEKDNHQQLCVLSSNSMKLDSNGSLTTNILFKSNEQLRDKINSLISEGNKIIYEGVTIIPSGKGACNISEPFLVEGTWDSTMYPALSFPKSNMEELHACQRYYQRIIDECINITPSFNNGDSKYIGSVHFRTTMVDVPTVTLHQKEIGYDNDLNDIPDMGINESIVITPINTSNDFALNTTSERYHLQGKANKTFDGDKLVIFTWEAECPE